MVCVAMVCVAMVCVAMVCVAMVCVSQTIPNPKPRRFLKPARFLCWLKLLVFCLKQINMYFY